MPPVAVVRDSLALSLYVAGGDSGIGGDTFTS